MPERQSRRPRPSGQRSERGASSSGARAAKGRPEKRRGEQAGAQKGRPEKGRAARGSAPKGSVTKGGAQKGRPEKGRAPRGSGEDGAQKGRPQGGRAQGAGAGRVRGQKGRPEKGRAKRTSKNSDERNPTRSGIDYPSAKFRLRDEEAPPEARSSLRRVKRPREEVPAGGARTPRTRKATPIRRRGIKSTEATDELARLARRNARSALEQLARAAEAFRAGREREAARYLRPLRDAYPDASAVRELLGLTQYRMGNYAAAAKELEAFVELTDSVEQHPVLMDCMRALGRYQKVDQLWEELAVASPSSALVTEGRIVLAGARADRGRVRDAIAILERRSGPTKRVLDHHLRLWYALADLYDRAGETPKARDLFVRIRRQDASFADVAERLAALA